MIKNQNIIDKLTTKEKVGLTAGENNWNTAKIESKGIKSVSLHDGPHGVRIQGVNSFVYPNLALLACSFDRNALFDVGRYIGDDCIKNGVDVLLAPGVNLKRNVLGGRNFEYFSEDVCLTSELASAYVKGVQKNGTSATVKHFCCNNQENYRMSQNSVVEQDVLFDTYLFPFYKIIGEASPDCIMTSYNKVNGEITNESSFLQKDVLRDKFGFDGVIMSDWGACADRITAIKNGMDLEMPGGDRKLNEEIAEKISEEKETERAFNRAADNVLSLVKKHEKPRERNFVSNDRKRITEIIAESIVMLKNDGDVLPLKKNETIGVYGDKAKTPVIQGGGCACVSGGTMTSPLQLLKKEYKNIVYVGCGGDLSRFKKVDKVIAFIGEESICSESYDRSGISLNKQEEREINEIYSINKKICAVVQNGGVVSLQNLMSECVLICYYAGQFFAEGLNKILSGEISPSGRLCESYPFDICNSPSYLTKDDKKDIRYREGNYIGYKYYDKKHIKVAYPFGYGTGYADIEYVNFDCNGVVNKNQSICGKIVLKNNGNVDQKEAVQIYYKNNYDIRLVHFDKVSVKAGSEVCVDFKIDADYFKRYENGKYVLKNDKGQLIIAKNSEEHVFRKEIAIEAETDTIITKDMLIEDVYNIHGAETVKKFFSGPLGIAMYGDENFILPIKGDLLSENPFEQNTSMMMPLKNLISFSGGKFTEKDLDEILTELNKRQKKPGEFFERHLIPTEKQKRDIM